MADARVIGTSIAVHAALIGVVGGLSSGSVRPPLRSAPRVELVEPVVVEVIAPIDVAFLTPDVAPIVVGFDAHAPMPSHTPSISVGAIGSTNSTDSTGSVVSTSSTGTETPGTSTAPSGAASASQPDLVLHGDVSPDQPPPPSAPPGESTLKQNGREYYVPDLVTTMKVDADGRARFVDKPDIDIHFTLPKLPSAKKLGDHLAGWYRDPYAQTRARKYQDMPRHEQAVPGGWDAGAGGDTNIDGTIQGPERQPGLTDGTVPILGGKLDITAWAMRKFGVGDPYASRKRKLLAGTEAERAQIRATHTRDQLDHSAQYMQKNVERVFREVLDPVERRAELFALWDECSEGEGAVGEAGERARAIVIGAIRGRLSGPDAFTAEEVAALDAKRTSKQHFAPLE